MEIKKLPLWLFDGSYYYCQKTACRSLGFKWMPRSPGLPKCCPRCKSYHWKEREEDRIKERS